MSALFIFISIGVFLLGITIGNSLKISTQFRTGYEIGRREGYVEGYENGVSQCLDSLNNIENQLNDKKI